MLSHIFYTILLFLPIFVLLGIIGVSNEWMRRRAMRVSDIGNIPKKAKWWTIDFEYGLGYGTYVIIAGMLLLLLMIIFYAAK